MSVIFAQRAGFGTVSKGTVSKGRASMVLACSGWLVLAAPACGGDNSDPTTTTSSTTNPGVGNTATTTGSTSSTSSSGAGGNTSSSTTASTTSTTSTTATSTTGSAACSMTAPPNSTISDFSDWTGTSWGADGNLTGGSFGPYMGSGTTDFNFVVNPTDAVLEVTGTINDYAGFGMWFGPCTDASTFTGVQFDISGIVGEAGRMVVQFQTSEDKAVEDGRGECTAASCVSPQATVEGVTETVTTVQLPFDSFAGGAPVDTLSPDQLLAIQFQFECETDAACAVDVVIDNLEFY